MAFSKLENVPSMQHMAFENLELAQYEGDGKYGIPMMLPCHKVASRFERYMDAKRIREPENVTAHFFYDDYKFISVWRHPERHVFRLMSFASVIAPDFSLYTSHPLTLQILAVYRRAWLTRYWQEQGIEVIPNVVWGGYETFDFCFDGIPKGSILAVSSVGVWRDGEWERGRFQDGFREMLARCEPEAVLWYGSPMPGFEEANVIRIPAYYERKRARLNAMRKSRSK